MYDVCFPSTSSVPVFTTETCQSQTCVREFMGASVSNTLQEIASQYFCLESLCLHIYGLHGGRCCGEDAASFLASKSSNDKVRIIK